MSKTAQTREDRAATANKILDVAERLVQVRGFNAFSYAHVAKELHISTAAMHYHFPGKAELGEALIARYAVRFMAALCEIDECVADPPRKLDAYVELYAGVLRNERMCMCGMFAAEQGIHANPGLGRQFSESTPVKLVRHEHVALLRR